MEPAQKGILTPFLPLSGRTWCVNAFSLRFYVVLLQSGRDTTSERVPHRRCGKPMFDFYMRFHAGHTPPWSRIVLNPVSLLSRFCVSAARLIYFGVPPGAGANGAARNPGFRLRTVGCRWYRIGIIAQGIFWAVTHRFISHFSSLIRSSDALFEGVVLLQ